MFGRGPSSGARNARIEIIDPREVLGCGNSRSDGQVVRQSLSNTSRSRCVAHCGPTTPRILRSLGRSDITAAPCRVLFAAIWTDLGLGVGLGGLPCGASDIQMTPITYLHLPLSLGSQWSSCSVEGRALELEMPVSGLSTRVRCQGAEIHEATGKWCASPCQIRPGLGAWPTAAPQLKY